jgi:phage terminase small subunit
MSHIQTLRQLIREEIHRLIERRTHVSSQEAKQVYDKLKPSVDFKQFEIGMNVELEHQDVTHGDLVQTAKIAIAHLKEVPDYYTKLKKYVESN